MRTSHFTYESFNLWRASFICVMPHSPVWHDSCNVCHSNVTWPSLVKQKWAYCNSNTHGAQIFFFFTFICKGWHSYVSHLVHLRDMTHTTCLTCLIHMCHASFTCVTWLIHICVMPHASVCRVSFICVSCVTWLIDMKSEMGSLRNEHTRGGCRVSFMCVSCVTWLIDMRSNVTHGLIAEMGSLRLEQTRGADFTIKHGPSRCFLVLLPTKVNCIIMYVCIYTYLTCTYVYVYVCIPATRCFLIL